VEETARLEAATTPAVAAPRWRAICRFALSVSAAGAFTFWLAHALRRPLKITTDIVGYTIHANFNSFNYRTQYYVTILVFPLVSIVLYELLGRVWRDSSWPTIAAREPEPGSWLQDQVERLGPSLGVGLCLGTVWLIYGPGTGLLDLGIALALSLLYVALLVTVASASARRSGRKAARLHALVNASIAPFSILLVEAVSRNTWVKVTAPGAVHGYHPVPTGLTLLLLAVVAAVAWSRLWQARDGAALRQIDRRVALWVTVPSLLFAFTAALEVPLQNIDLFHFGEPTGAANVVLHGAFPWRDVVFIHGLLQDPVAGVLGFKAFGHSLWGAQSAYAFFLAPACWISYYFLFLYLFTGRFSIVLAALAVPVTWSYAHLHVRFVPYPLILLALGGLLRVPSWRRAFLLALALVAGNVLVPELAYAVPACAVVLVIYDWSHRGTRREPTAVFVRTWKVFVWGVALAACWAIYLGGHSALGAFIDFYRTFAPGHELMGAIRIEPASYGDHLYVALMLLPPVLVVLTVWGCVAAWRSATHLDDREWVMIAAAIVTAAYYQKFLSRPDNHVTHAFAPAIPLLFYAVHRLLRAVETLTPRGWGRWVHGLGPAALALVLVSGPPRDVLARVAAVRTHFQFSVSHEPALAGVGWSGDSAVQLAADVASIQRFIAAYLGPSETIFDFTNQPGLYHSILDLKPASRFFHVSMAIRPATQQQVISDLERTRPPLVVYQSETGGLGPWDGIPNDVRHHEISRFILDHYRPLGTVAGQTFFIDKSRGPDAPAREQSPDARNGYLIGIHCDWGYAPNFLEPEPMVAGPPAIRRSSSTAMRLEASGWALNADRSGPAAMVVAVGGHEILGRTTTGLRRPDVAAIYGPSAERSGFHLLGETQLKAPLGPLRFFGVTATGKADELPMPTVSRDLPKSLLIDGSAVPVVAGSIKGYVDVASATREEVTEFDLPPGLATPRIAGVELEVRARREGGVAISAAPPSIEATLEEARGVRGVMLRVVRSPAIRLQVELDSCPSWRVTNGTKLFVRADEGVEIDSVRPLMRPAVTSRR
jgi:hypothetical protein